MQRKPWARSSRFPDSIVSRRVFCRLFVLVVEVVEEYGCVPFVEGAAVLLRGTSCAACAIDKAADARHLKDFVLLGRRDVLEDFWQEFCPNAFLDGLQNAEGVGDGRLAHAHLVAILDVARGFCHYAIDVYAVVLAGFSRKASRLVEARSPKPFVDTCFHDVCDTSFNRLLPARLLIIIIVHGEVEAAEGVSFYSICGKGDALVHVCEFFVGEFAENVVYLVAVLEVAADAEA